MGLCSRSTAAALAATALLVSLSGCGWGGFTFNSNTPAISIMADYTTPAISVTVGPQNDTPFDVQVTATPPAGFTCNPTCTITTRHTATFHFDTPSDLAQGTYTIPIQAIGGGWTRNTSTQVTVTAWNGIPPPPDFDFSVSPASIAFLYAAHSKTGESGFIDYAFTVVRYNHYTGPIYVTTQVANNFTCAPAPCDATITGDSLVAPFGIGVYGNFPFQNNVFTATAPPGVVRTADGVVYIQVPTPPPSTGPSPQAP